MGSSCPLLSSPTGNDPAFPKLAFLAHSHAGGHGAPFGLAIKESLLSEKSYSLVKEHRAAGVKLLPAPAQEGLSGLEAPQFTTDIFSRKLGTAGEKVFENLSTLLSESAPGFVPMLCPFTLQRTEICRLLSMAVRKTFLRELVSTQAIFKTLRGDRACKALSLGEVAAAVRLRKAGFGEGTPQQDSDGTE